MQKFSLDQGPGRITDVFEASTQRWSEEIVDEDPQAGAFPFPLSALPEYRKIPCTIPFSARAQRPPVGGRALTGLALSVSPRSARPPSVADASGLFRTAPLRFSPP